MNKKFFEGVDPEEAFLDSSNLPGFNSSAMEGRLVRALSGREVYTIGILLVLILAVFLYQLFSLQIIGASHYTQLARDNRLAKPILFAERGIITDRAGRELAWNEPLEGSNASDQSTVYSLRKYTLTPGMAHLLGYVSYPETDESGHWWRTNFIPHGGVEQSFDALLRGKNGNKLIEVDATQQVVSSGAIVRPIDGETLQLSIDASVTEQLFTSIKDGATIAGFVGGAGVIIDVSTGEVIAITSYPEYDSNVLTDAADRDTIVRYSNDAGKPFLNRSVQGTYTPGSIVKPYIGSVALEEGVITEYTKILSTGVLKVPNPYYPGQFSTFRDWRTGFGFLDIREAIKMSSSIFFYVIGGGFESQKGIGIEKISLWAERFGLGQKTGIALPGEKEGLVPTPEWKREIFDAEWNLGNTYHSSIGQYGWLVTPIQAAKYIASIANGGTLHSPLLVADSVGESVIVPIQDKNLQIIREGMHRGAQSGTAQALNVKGITIAAKTGTAQLGINNEHMNSWVVGFWPYEDPKYAFAVVLEKAPADTLRGAAPAMRPFFEWLVQEHGDDYAVGQYPHISDQ
jgi:penicillin-binding protein 2